MKAINLNMTIKYDEQTKAIDSYDLAGKYSVVDIAVIVSAFRGFLQDCGYEVKPEKL